MSYDGQFHFITYWRPDDAAAHKRRILGEFLGRRYRIWLVRMGDSLITWFSA